jgi:5-oxoprolinase (ATP-hydrolysing) subunit A
MVIDLNGDLGESYGHWRAGDEAALVTSLTSANLACGFHAGDPCTLRAAIHLAATHRVAIGAHPSYPDLRGFGRVAMALPPAQVRDDVLYQLGALQALCHAEGEPLRHVKPHGALYHAVAEDPATAEAFAEAVAAFDAGLPVIVRAGSRAAEVIEAAGLRVLPEAFPDVAYRSDGSPVPRQRPGALIDDLHQLADRAVRLARDGSVTSVDGSELRLAPVTLSLADRATDRAARARRVRDALVAAGVELRAATA